MVAESTATVSSSVVSEYLRLVLYPRGIIDSIPEPEPEPEVEPEPEAEPEPESYTDIRYVSLSEGWNLLGSSVDVNIENNEILRNKIINPFYSYTADGYVEINKESTLESNNGYWIYSLESTIITLTLQDSIEDIPETNTVNCLMDGIWLVFHCIDDNI